MASYEKITNTLDFAVAFNPSGAFPLDARSMFGSYAAAAAAASKAEMAGSSNTTYYIGQTLTVVENDVVSHFSIEADKTLKPLGSIVATDDKTIVISGEKLSLKDFGTQYYAFKHKDNILESGEYTYPDTMPEGVEGAYVQVDGVWYKYSTDSWSVFDGTPHSADYYELTVGWKAGLEPKVVGDGSSGYSIAWYEPSSTTVEGLQDSIASLQTKVSDLDSKVNGFQSSIQSNASAIEAEVTRATQAEGTLTTRLSSAESAITTLNGNELSEGSVKYQVNAAIAKVVAEAPESFDTLKEIADWISTHSESALEMNNNIVANQTAIAALETLVGTLPPEALATDIIGYIAEAIAVETARATQAEKALGARVTAVESSVSGFGTAAKKNVEDFATASQGSLAESAVQSVSKGENGHINVDGADIEVYKLPTMSTSQIGGAKVDGTSLEVTPEGALSIKAIDQSKVTGLSQSITSSKEEAVETANNYTDTNAIAKTSICTSENVSASVDQASNDKVVSEIFLLELFTWKNTM